MNTLILTVSNMNMDEVKIKEIRTELTRIEQMKQITSNQFKGLLAACTILEAINEE